MKKLIQVLLISGFLLSSAAEAAHCIYNETKSTDTDHPAENYKFWALQKMCFDVLLEPNKISTLDDQLNMVFYKPTRRELIVLPTGGGQVRIFATDLANASHELKITFNLDHNGTPLAIISRTSDEFEFVSSL